VLEWYGNLYDTAVAALSQALARLMIYDQASISSMSNLIKPSDFLQKVQLVTAIAAIGPSSLRNQGAPGLIGCVRQFLADLELQRFVVPRRLLFEDRLDEETEALLAILPVTTRSWGAARKALNLFLRDALYSAYLSSHFQLAQLEPWLEIPLDSTVARGLKSRDRAGHLPQWPGLKHLEPVISRLYQSTAAALAEEVGIARVHLDIYLWLENR
jgi:hypothetical protein